MKSWADLNFTGRLLFICAIINILVTVVFIFDSNGAAIFSILMAMFCGMSTYNSRYSRI